MHLWQQPQVEHNPKAKLLSGCFVSCFLKYSSALRLHCRMQHVASSWGLLLSGYCSLTPLLQVIIRALKRSMPPLCSPFTPEWDPLQIKHWLSSQQDLCCRHIVYQKQPQPLQALLRRAHSSGEWCCIEASCAKLPPLSGQRHRGTVGASPVLTQSVCSSNWC